MKTFITLLATVVGLFVASLAQAAAPAQPQNVQQAWVEPESLLFWRDVPEATSYNVYRSDNTNATWVLVGSTTAPRFRDASLQFLPSAYVVTAVNADGESSGSELSTVDFGAYHTVIIYQPSEWAGTLTATNAVVRFVGNDVNGSQGLVDWGLSITNFTGFLLNTNYLDYHTFELTNLSPRTLYYYRLTSITSNRVGVSYTGWFGTLDTNYPPYAEDYTWTWPMGTNALWIPLRGHDSNFPPTTLTYRIVSLPTNGVLSKLRPGWAWNEAAVVYTPAPGARGNDYFRYVVNNGTWDSPPALVTVTNWVNTPPFATNAMLTIDEDTTIALTLPTFDAEGDPVTFYVPEYAGFNGTVSGTPPNVVFTPATNFNGDAYFYYYADDGFQQSFGSIQLEVTPVNDKPVISTNFFSSLTTSEDWPVSFWISAFDVDGGSSYDLVVVNPPAHGVVTGNAWSATYTPETNFFGTDSFTLAIREGDGTTSDPVTFPVEVFALNDPPVPFDIDVAGPEDTQIIISPSGFDLEGDTIWFQLTTYPTNGWVWDTGANFVYQPYTNFSGSDAFEFRALDQFGFYAWNTFATARIQVLDVNETPVAWNTNYLLHAEATVARGLPVFDGDGDALSIEVVSLPTNGTLVIEGSNFTYTATGESYADSFSYRASDGLANGNTATVSLWIGTTNVVPVAADQSTNAPQNGSVLFTLAVEDPDADDISLGVLITAPAHGTVEFVSPWQVIYTPNWYYFGADSFSYTPDDGFATGNVATVSIDVPRLYNQRPFFGYNGLTVLVSEDVPQTLNLSMTDYDGDALTYTLVTPPTRGTLTGTFPFVTYVPGTNFFGNDSFFYKANDGWEDSAANLIRVEVMNVYDAPVVADLVVVTTEDVPVTFTLPALSPDARALTYQFVGPTNGVLSGSSSNRTFSPSVNWNGTDLIQFRVNDGSNWSGYATITINVASVNDAPLASAMSLSLGEDTTRAFTLSASDADGDALSYIIVNNPAHGSLTGTGANRVYVPVTNFFGSDSFTFKVNDGTADSATRTVSITVTGTNDVPIVVDQTFTLAEDTTITFKPSVIDPDGDATSYAIFTYPSNGTFTFMGQGNLLYRPNANFHGTDSFSFVGIAGGHSSDTIGTITFNVTSVNDGPDAISKAYLIPEDTSLAVNLAGLVNDADGDALTYTIVTPPGAGTLTGTLPNLVYRPNTNFWGYDRFYFKASDGLAETPTREIWIEITSVNDAPLALNTSFALAEDGVLSLSPSSTDVDGFPPRYRVVSGPTNGTLTVSGTYSNVWTYRPATNFHGTDSVVFIANDVYVDSNPGTVTVAVTPVNDTPVAIAQSVVTAEDTAANLTLSGSDVDGDALNYAIASGPANGTLSGAAPNLVYTPNADFNGSDSFTFIVNDSSAASAPATVVITVTAVNDRPLPSNTTVTLAEDSSAIFMLAGADAEGSALSFTLLSLPQFGTISGTAPNLTYTPSANFNGADSLQFIVSDGSLSATGVVSFLTTPVNDIPVAANRSITLNEDWILNTGVSATDIDGDVLTFRVVSSPAGALSFSSNGSFTYRGPTNYHGVDSFTFVANDGTTDGNVATVTLTLTPMNDMPSVTNQAATTAEDTAVAIAPWASDLDGDVLTFTVITPPAHGSVTWDGSAFVYTPVANYNGTDSFGYRANDGTANSALATININVTPVNDTPVANAQSVTVAYNTAKAVALTGGDTEGSALTFTIVSGPTNGTLSGTAPNLTYTPAIGSAGADRFTFIVNDDTSSSAAATVSITTQNPIGIPTAPASLTVTVPTAAKTLILNWSCTATNEDGFKIERSLSSGSGWSEIATTGINIHTFTNTGLTSNTRYYYRVRSYNRLGHSAYSNTVNARPR